jgi:hypothetical protein
LRRESNNKTQGTRPRKKGPREEEKEGRQGQTERDIRRRMGRHRVGVPVAIGAIGYEGGRPRKVKRKVEERKKRISAGS